MKLNPNQWEDILNTADIHSNGVVKFGDFIPLALEIIILIFMKNQAVKSLNQREEEYLL